MAITAPDLTKRPPRSPRVRLGGYVILPRILDKGRATIVRKNGEFNFDCPLDQCFLNFVGIRGAALKKQLAMGKGDGEILEWIGKHAKHKRSDVEIATWSDFMDRRSPCDLETHGFFIEYQSKIAPNRKDVSRWFELLDIDDFVTFGGIA